jgi:hypothetical protein
VPCRYNTRIYGLLRDFGARFADIEAIYRQTMVAGRLRVAPQWWKRLWSKIWNRFASESVRTLAFMRSLDENQIIDVTCDALSGMIPAHKRFKERHMVLVDAATGDQRNRIFERRQLNRAAPMTAARNGTRLPLNSQVPDGFEKSASILASATSVHKSSRRDESLSQISRVENIRAAEVKGIDNSFQPRFRQDAKGVQVEQVVVQQSDLLFPSQQRAKGALDHNQVHMQVVNAKHFHHVHLWKDSADKSASAQSGQAASAVGCIDPQRSPDQGSHDVKLWIARRFKDANIESEPKARENSQFTAATASNNGSLSSADCKSTLAHTDQV